MRATLTHEHPEAGAASIELDLEEIRRRLVAAAPAAEALAGDLGAARERAALTPASVLVPIVAHRDALSVLFTRRTAHLRTHSGQVSFPGGRVEPHDAGPEETALRETQEEIGLARECIELIGMLPEYHTRTGYRIMPVVGVIAPPLMVRADPREVEAVFEVPLSFLLDPRNHQRHTRVFQGRMISYFAMPYGEHYIWGATAAMLVNLYRQLVHAER
ncbi:MAG: CoA pyrophosphatase [Burkholderiales bacterium]|nr:CoA pyrophosphatase [Burkholderiales bacterium]